MAPYDPDDPYPLEFLDDQSSTFSERGQDDKLAHYTFSPYSIPGTTVPDIETSPLEQVWGSQTPSLNSSGGSRASTTAAPRGPEPEAGLLGDPIETVSKSRKSRHSRNKGSVSKAIITAEPDDEDAITSFQEAGAGSRRSKILERNRMAALKCRKKKKKREDELETRSAQLETKNMALRAELTSLTGELSQTKSEVMDHAACKNLQIDMWIKEETSNFMKAAKERYMKQMCDLAGTGGPGLSDGGLALSTLPGIVDSPVTDTRQISMVDSPAGAGSIPNRPSHQATSQQISPFVPGPFTNPTASGIGYDDQVREFRSSRRLAAGPDLVWHHPAPIGEA